MKEIFLRPFVLLFFCPFILPVLTSCSEDEEEAYPPLITELVMAQADAQGIMASFTTDAGINYSVDNQIKGMTANSLLRCLCGYTIEQQGHAKVYQAQAVPILGDWTAAKPKRRDPTGVQSIWISGGYINLHLTPKTHGDKQAWGFTQDSVKTNVSGNTTHHLSLYHHQMDDAIAYTTDLYACIPLDSISALAPHDSIRLTIRTFSTPAVWQFACP